MGPSSIANAKLEAAPELVVLGVYLIPSRKVLECWPSAGKVAALVFWYLTYLGELSLHCCGAGKNDG